MIQKVDCNCKWAEFPFSYLKTLSIYFGRSIFESDFLVSILELLRESVFLSFLFPFGGFELLALTT